MRSAAHNLLLTGNPIRTRLGRALWLWVGKYQRGLNLVGLELSLDTLQSILQCCPNLEYLEISGKQGDYKCSHQWGI